MHKNAIRVEEDSLRTLRTLDREVETGKKRVVRVSVCGHNVMEDGGRDGGPGWEWMRATAGAWRRVYTVRRLGAFWRWRAWTEPRECKVQTGAEPGDADRTRRPAGPIDHAWFSDSV